VQNTATTTTNTGNVLTDFVAKNAAGKNITPKTYTKDQNGKWTATSKDGKKTNVNNEGIINQLEAESNNLRKANVPATESAVTKEPTSLRGVKYSDIVVGDAPLKENEYYHATDNNEIIAPSDKGYKKREGNNVVGEGIYFGKDKEHLTDRYGKNAIKVELDIKNPLVSENKYIVIDGREIDVQSLSKEDVAFLKEKGYDAIKYVAADKSYSKYDETIIFDKSQIKKSETLPKEVKAVEELINNNTNEKESNSNQTSTETQREEGQVGTTVGQEGEVSTTQTDGNTTETPSVAAEVKPEPKTDEQQILDTLDAIGMTPEMLALIGGVDGLIDYVDVKKLGKKKCK